MHDHSAVNFWFVLVRAVHFGACLLLLGTFCFDRFIASAAPMAERQWKAIARRLLLIGLALSLLTGAGWFGFVAMAMSGLPAGQAFEPQVLSTVWNQTRFGQVFQDRLICWLLSGIIAIPFVCGRGPRTRAVWAWPGLAASGLLVAGLAWAGHGQNGTAHLIADILHLLVSAVWPVGLLPLGMLLMRLVQAENVAQPPSAVFDRRSKPFSAYGGTQPRAADFDQLSRVVLQNPPISQLVRRFSLVSILAVLLLTASGLVNTWVLVGSVSNLLTTAYGRVLLLKIGLFAVMLAIGAINLLYLKPRIDSRADPLGFVRRVQFNVSLEILLAAAVLGVVGLLGLLEPGM
ncbi:MAG TPA: CopD family protein [Tepidisphaeraceae bacterium]|nr:CopD family protein [Tepidisphaeraceae bacterium]